MTLNVNAGFDGEDGYADRAGWLLGKSDKCPRCGSDIDALEAKIMPAAGEVEATYNGILEIDVKYRGRCPSCKSALGFTARYKFDHGHFDLGK